MIDGEGHIGLGYATNRYRGGFKTILNVTNTSLVGVRRCLEIAGCGTIYPNRTKPPRLPAFFWGVRAQNTAAVLTMVLPYLVMKRRQAQLVIRAQSLIGPRGRRNLHHEELKEIFDELHELHHSGDGSLPERPTPQKWLDFS